MNIYIINSIGLAFDIIGAWFVAVEVVYRFKGQKYRGNLALDSNTSPVVEGPESLQYTNTKNIYMWIGLDLLTIGFGLQIYLNLSPHGNVNNVITINDGINNKCPTIAIGENRSGEPIHSSAKPDIHNKSQNKPLKDKKLLKEEK